MLNTEARLLIPMNATCHFRTVGQLVICNITTLALQHAGPREETATLRRVPFGYDSSDRSGAARSMHDGAGKRLQVTYTMVYGAAAPIPVEHATCMQVSDTIMCQSLSQPEQWSEDRHTNTRTKINTVHMWKMTCSSLQKTKKMKTKLTPRTVTGATEI